MSVQPYTKLFPAIVRITPAPTTLAESSTILNHLRSIAPVLVFLNPRYQPSASEDLSSGSSSVHEILVSPSSKTSNLLSSSPYTITYPPIPEPDPEEVDPFGVRGLSLRKAVTSKTFQCEVIGDKSNFEAHRIHAKNNAFHGQFKVDRKSLLYESLIKAGAPVSIVDGLSGEWSGDESQAEKEDGNCKSTARTESITTSTSSAKAVQTPSPHPSFTTLDPNNVAPNLMSIYRTAVSRQAGDIPVLEAPTSTGTPGRRKAQKLRNKARSEARKREQDFNLGWKELSLTDKKDSQPGHDGR